MSTTAGTKSHGNIAKKGRTCESMHLSVSQVCVKVLPVTVWNDSKTRCVDTYAFFAEVSDVTLSSNKLLENLGIADAVPYACTLQAVNCCMMCV